MRRTLIIVCLGLGGWLDDGARAEDLPLQGAVSGRISLELLPELDLGWELEMEPGGTVVLRGRRPGLWLEVEARATSAALEIWTWRVRRGDADGAELWPLVRELAGPDAAGWSASGRVELSGEGRWTAEAGLSGELRVTLRDGWARSDALDIEVAGIEWDGRVDDLGSAALPDGQVLRVARVGMAGAQLTDLRVLFGMSAEQVLRVQSVEAGLLGGRVRLKPFAVALANPALTAQAEVEAIELSELARLMPWILTAAQGKLRGRVELAWDGLKGLRLRDGGLDIVKSDEATLRLAPTPGLLTGKMSDVIGFFPAEMRWARRIGLRNPVYHPLREIELGREGLQIETFRVSFWPDGSGEGASSEVRSASIEIVGRPTGREFVEEVRLDFNFYGPLNEVMGFGLNQDFGGIDFRVE